MVAIFLQDRLFGGSGRGGSRRGGCPSRSRSGGKLERTDRSLSRLHLV